MPRAAPQRPVEKDDLLTGPGDSGSGPLCCGGHVVSVLRLDTVSPWRVQLERFAGVMRAGGERPVAASVADADAHDSAALQGQRQAGQRGHPRLSPIGNRAADRPFKAFGRACPAFQRLTIYT